MSPLIADDIVVTDQADVRCPQCTALVKAGAQWCTLCYADLRPAPAAAPVAVLEPSPAGARQPAATATASSEATGSSEATDGSEATANSEIKAVGWPCSGCVAIVSFDETICPTCGAGFLEGARGEPDILDRIGTGLPVSTQAMIIAGGAAAIIALIISALYIFGAIF